MHAYARHQSWTEKATISNHVETLVDTYTNSTWWTCACNGFPTQQPVAHACGGAEKASGMHAGGGCDGAWTAQLECEGETAPHEYLAPCTAAQRMYLQTAMPQCSVLIGEE